MGDILAIRTRKRLLYYSEDLWQFAKSSLWYGLHLILTLTRSFQMEIDVVTMQKTQGWGISRQTRSFRRLC